MCRRRRTIQERIDERRPDFGRLVRDFSHFVDVFATEEQFVGPSVYFHTKTIEVLRSHTTAADALGDDQFFEYLYATLTSWGLHRMGPGNTKLRRLDEFKATFRAQASNVERLQHLRIEELRSDEVPVVVEVAWEIISNLKVGIGETLLIANSKALHHLLPDLIPPIDRTYTLKFFTDRREIYPGRDAELLFRAIYPLFHEIAVLCSVEIDGFITVPPAAMNTSVTKVIDNAIVGFMIAN